MLQLLNMTMLICTNKLVVGDKLKEVLCSHLLLGDKDADDICNGIFNDGKDVGVIGGNKGRD